MYFKVEGQVSDAKRLGILLGVQVFESVGRDLIRECPLNVARRAWHSCGVYDTLNPKP